MAISWAWDFIQNADLSKLPEGDADFVRGLRPKKTLTSRELTILHRIKRDFDNSPEEIGPRGEISP
jgi:hypothetical protein